MSSERQPPDDRELEDFFAGRHPVGRAYREASENDAAPTELDAAILAAARESVRTRIVRRLRWVQPVALAATLVLGLSVLMNVWRDPQTRERIVPAAPVAPKQVTGESVVEMQSEPSADAAAKPAPSATPEKKKSEPPPTPAEPPPAAAPPPPPPAASGAATERQQPSFYPLIEPAPGRETSPAMAPPAASASAPSAAERDATHEAESRLRADDAQKQRRMEEALPQAAPRAAAPEPDSADRLGSSAEAQESTSVEQWIERVRAELARGDESAARDSLAAFRRAYPDTPLPEDLTAFERSAR